MKAITKVKKEVTTLANRLNKKLHDLSAAFRRAWQIIKGRVLISKVAGVTFSNRQAALARLRRPFNGQLRTSNRFPARDADSGSRRPTRPMG